MIPSGTRVVCKTKEELVEVQTILWNCGKIIWPDHAWGDLESYLKGTESWHSLEIREHDTRGMGYVPIDWHKYLSGKDFIKKYGVRAKHKLLKILHEYSL